MQVEPGLYKHYKGKQYEVLGVGRHSETNEVLVIYKALYLPPEEQLWVRPLTMFTETISYNGQTVPRFTKL